MSEQNSSGVKNGDCCNQRICPYSEEELSRYAEKVQRLIDENDCEVFLNRSEWHAAIILRKFIESAKETINIFCGHLNKNVYGDLLPSFQAAAERGVKVRVMTASPEVCAKDVAEGLRSMGAFQSLRDVDEEAPHFAIIDGMRYRLETCEADKSAVVCAYADTKEQVRRAFSLDLLFNFLWDISAPDTV
ncbi:MAG: hypothetical protein Q4A24_06500 [Akkermansia sp.]|nr:hypothetical protein [Akkermansia sp.]